MNNYFPGVEKPSLCQHFPGPEGHLFPQQPQPGEKPAFKLCIPGRYLVRAINSAWAERAQNMSHKPHWGLGRLKKLVLWVSHRVSGQDQSSTSPSWLLAELWQLLSPLNLGPHPGNLHLMVTMMRMMTAMMMITRMTMMMMKITVIVTEMNTDC